MIMTCLLWHIFVENLLLLTQSLRFDFLSSTGIESLPNFKVNREKYNYPLLSNLIDQFLFLFYDIYTV